MKFTLAASGSRGDVEPFAALGLELQRRGHEVRIGVPPDMLRFVESAGLAAVAYGPDTQEFLARDTYSQWRQWWKILPPIKALQQLRQAWADMATDLKSLADGADLVMTGVVYQGVVANVAEYYGIPFGVLHFVPARVNGKIIPSLPSPLNRAILATVWRAHWLLAKKPEDAQRRELGLPKATSLSTRRIVKRGALEIQAYDELCFPGLAAEWAEYGDRRPFVGALTLELPTAADNEVLSWIAAGTPPIYFGFGSMPIVSPTDTVAMIAAACADLGERALISVKPKDLTQVPKFDHVKIVTSVSHAAVFPACRAVVHHGGAGTTAASLRAGVPTLILWIFIEQPVWAAQIKRLKVGAGRRFSATTQRSLAADLRTILAPQYATRAREVANRMSKPDESVNAAADLLEDKASRNKSRTRYQDC
ncbi:glycosyl transferase [Mycobacterium leprae Kyoto-2]|uniref:Uncharacterized glycosyltransferase ML2348 n=3 Tax=Mycobacterium leprae TaxID=1769 RepID=Y2348_MYCLE|nr:glycosyltransferase [Mycobacterium leprae]Q49929.1 RecName: Full=Uncharacterized glycosyltransferase ML2348 [Mycobacterium leprae TN]CAR72446.1 putative glycosyl transferase [Mycobacterium leprae Br4923]AAA17353.1 L518_C2_147 [Mycobacterium leprae]AWV48639.1 glycosyltransferase [Mycobacterium leprae]OAR21106.1 glycosyltransferase [Mycobacterium leprae 3125609]OAX72105.1 glycosyltransferase [Mycobacterium leprae 7935681]